jgi:hypothetical protein
MSISWLHDLSLRATHHEFGGSDDRLTGTQWQAVVKKFGAVQSFALSGDTYCMAFAKDIIDCVPPGSVYFGGTDSGRFLVTAMSKSHVKDDPVFTLTQNA